MILGHTCLSVPHFSHIALCFWAFQLGLVVKNLPANAGGIRDMASIPGSGRSPGGGHGHPLQYSCLENPMDRGVWQAAVHRVEKDWTWLKQLSLHALLHYGCIVPFRLRYFHLTQCFWWLLNTSLCASTHFILTLFWAELCSPKIHMLKPQPQDLTV